MALGVCEVPQKPISGSQPQRCPAAEVDAAARRAGLAPTTSPWASPGIHTATQPASTLNVLQINPTEGRTRREDCSETKRPPVPRAAQPKKHKCQHRGESEGVRPAGGAAFWQEPRVTGWLQRPQDSRSPRVRNPVFQERQNVASPFTSPVFCLSCCGHQQILSRPLQLFLTWTCSVICFTHSTEMAQLRGLDKVESHTVVKPNRFTVLNCPDIRRQRNQGIL
ncbi:uncharacterized protein [Anser cygnoides]|uniref:uncharacterized protein isoform X2 n=1 Tax=Anser cygnoides TaxID=8845 RepID=UPI0034D305AE